MGGGSSAARAIQNWFLLACLVALVWKPIAGMWSQPDEAHLSSYQIAQTAMAKQSGFIIPVATNTLMSLQPSVIHVQVDYPTAQATTTLTPVPTQMKVGIDGHIYTVGYSYYFPDLLGTNCFGYSSFPNGHCPDTTASGLSWRDYLHRGIAVPPVWLTRWGYGSIVRVLSPSVIAGDYTILDQCAACDKSNWTAYDSRDRVDFLDDTQRLQWDYDVTFILIAWVKPK